MAILVSCINRDRSGKNLSNYSGSGGCSHFFHNLLNVAMDSFRGKGKSLRNFFVGKPFCKAEGYLSFPFGKSELFLDSLDVKFVMHGNTFYHNESAGTPFVVGFE